MLPSLLPAALESKGRAPASTHRARARDPGTVSWAVHSSGRPFDQLARQAQVALRALAADIIEQCGQTVGRSFTEPHVARDDRFEDAEVLVHLFRHLVR